MEILKEIIPKILKDDEKQQEIAKTRQETLEAIEKIVNANVQPQSQDSQYIKYKPSQQSAAFNSGAKERVIRMVEMPVDPLEPPKFKHKRVPKANGSPPVPVMQSPPRPVTVKDQQDWKIPPCVSNWKNLKGYTIPLDKRLAADGRGLQEVQINDNFAKISEALYVAEQQAREAVSMRYKVRREMMMKEKERKEQELRELAQKARSERTGTRPTAGSSFGLGSVSIAHVYDINMDELIRPEHEHKHELDREWDPSRETKEERGERVQREKIREERRRERERERRLEAKDAAIGKKSKITQDGDRDISEKVALGMASAGSVHGGEVMYDQRLFNQEKGMGSVFETDDQYNVYDKGLFTAQPTLSTLYRLNKDGDEDMYGEDDEQLEKFMKTDQFKPDKGFTGEKSVPRGGAVEFEGDAVEDADLYGLDKFWTEVEGGKKLFDKSGSGGTMRSSGGGS